MRRRYTFLIGALLAAVSFGGCEGSMGPAGPAGEQGPPGLDGQSGLNGTDGTENCASCHTNDTGLFARQVQYQNSVHFNGGNFERSEPDCAPCHTHQGFVERIATGAQATAAAIENPAPVNCRTCHKIHTTYTSEDYSLTVSAPVALWAGGTVDLGKGNLCAECHQARPMSAAETPVIDGGPVTFTSSRYGYHHGPQAQVVGGTGGFEFTGSMTIETGVGVHGSGGGACVDCHMGEPFGSQAGGHTWAMKYLYHGTVEDLTSGCAACHGAMDDFNEDKVQTTVRTQLDSLQVLLRKIGIVHASSDSRVPGTYPANVAAAAVNFQMILEDRSLGVHNPDYVVPLLNNTIEKMVPLAAASNR